MPADGEKNFLSFEALECYAGTIVNAPGCTYGPRMQSELQLVLLHSGSMHIEIDGIAKQLQPGHVFLILPGHQVYIAFDEKEETWHRWITVFTYRIEAEELDVLEGLPESLPISEQLNQLLDIMVGLQKQGIQGGNKVRNTLALGAFQLYAAECRSGAIDSAVHPAIPQVKSLIQERYHDELALADLAANANVSPGHLIRLFRKYEEMTPTQYLWRYRVERGVELLRTTGLAVGEIAERCGFKTSYHFARMVRAYKGRPPKDIRSNVWSS
ncbi:AraC family transcriptional regulator [Paenibacillus mendelii]|uniref:AraC family transcriptional regulator n=1 Tax=Paenibacillus mendelii TaxID=206163 RepID=A0ABV6JAE2_9BACL|nr:AraC family transcriptional regulator [Paenibacillus mendelii]MCQ6560760.1 AraC family transcriptional regulator [Paenibacillus mendelii]